MARLAWSFRARDDLRDVRRFIARDSPRQAALMVERLRASALRLRDFPESGRILPESPSGRYREVIENPYRIVYRYLCEQDTVEVLMVVHGSRQLPPLSDIST